MLPRSNSISVPCGQCLNGNTRKCRCSFSRAASRKRSRENPEACKVCERAECQAEWRQHRLKTKSPDTYSTRSFLPEGLERELRNVVSTGSASSCIAFILATCEKFETLKLSLGGNAVGKMVSGVLNFATKRHLEGV